MTRKPSRLIIAPHVDDDVIGCGGLLAAVGEECLVLYMGVENEHIVKKPERYKEAYRVAEITGHEFLWPEAQGDRLAPPSGIDKHSSGYRVDRLVNRYEADLPGLIRDIEWVISTYPSLEEAYLPWPSYNQDHQAVYRAAMVALRPVDYLPLIPRVFLYEEPDCFWPGAGEPFKATAFREIDLGAKLRLYLAMASQVRPHRSGDHLKALAVMRGGHIMKNAAEAYHVVRMVV